MSDFTEVKPNTTGGVDGFLDVAIFLADYDPPQVITMSYALDETAWAFSITQ